MFGFLLPVSNEKFAFFVGTIFVSWTLSRPNFRDPLDLRRCAPVLLPERRIAESSRRVGCLMRLSTLKESHHEDSGNIAQRRHLVAYKGVIKRLKAQAQVAKGFGRVEADA